MSAKILLCEDDEFLRSGLEEMLQNKAMQSVRQIPAQRRKNGLHREVLI